jgi:hypothetical protein
MKKMKIMLLSFALLAIVGAALAFRAKGETAFCTADVEPSGALCKVDGVSTNANKACPIRINLTTQAGTETPRFTYCYTTPVAGRTDCLNAAGSADLLCTTPTASFKTIDATP